MAGESTGVTAADRGTADRGVGDRVDATTQRGCIDASWVMLFLDRTTRGFARFGGNITSVPAQVLISRLAELKDDDIVNLLIDLKKTDDTSGSDYLQRIISMMNVSLMRDFVSAREGFYSYVSEHWKPSFEDVCAFLGGVAFGILEDYVGTIQFVFDVTKSRLREEKDLLESILLFATGKNSEAKVILLRKVEFYAEAVREFFLALTSLVKELRANPIGLLSEKLTSFSNRFKNHLKRFEFFEAGKMIGPIAGLILTAIVGLLRAGLAVGRRLLTLLARVDLSAVKRFLTPKNTRRLFEHLKKLANGEIPFSQELSLDGFGNIGFGPDFAYAYAIDGSTGRATRLLNVFTDDLVFGVRELYSKAVHLADDGLSDLIEEVAKTFEDLKVKRQLSAQERKMLKREAEELKDLGNKKKLSRAKKIPKEILERVSKAVRDKYPEDVFRFIWSMEEDIKPGLKKFRLRPIDNTRHPQEWARFQKAIGDQRGYTFGGRWPELNSKKLNINFEIDNLDIDGWIDEGKHIISEPTEGKIGDAIAQLGKLRRVAQEANLPGIRFYTTHPAFKKIIEERLSELKWLGGEGGVFIELLD